MSVGRALGSEIHNTGRNLRAVLWMNPKIIPGYKVGKLTVTKKAGTHKSGYSLWSCSCECGGEIELDTRTLQRGAVLDCGCGKLKPRQRDITGMRFGMLTAQYPTGQMSKRGAVWRCSCDCGGEVDAPLSQLTAGYRKTCGCRGQSQLLPDGTKDLVGKRFGKLVVQKYAGKLAGMHRWKCLCDCGNETVVGQTLLQSGKTKSCGCLQKQVYQDNFKFIDGTSVSRLEHADKLSASNTSGYNGVYQNKKTGKWAAQITLRGKTTYLGSYNKIEDAVKARRDAEKLYDEILDWYYAENKK